MRIAVTVLCVLAAACRDSPPADIAARLDEQRLSTSRLAEILVLSQPLPLRRDVAQELAREWLHVSAVAARFADGDSLLGPEPARIATVVETRQRLAEAYLGAQAAQRVPAPARVVDSIYDAGVVRLFAHIFRRVGAETRPEEKELQRLTAQRIRRDLLAGAPWLEANRESEDPIAREAGGLLGLVRRGTVVPEFEEAAFALQPGELSPVVETRFGYHIIHRPTLNDARHTFTELAMEELAANAAATTAEQLAETKRMAFTPEAATVVRRIAADPWAVVHSTEPIATYEGGRLTVGKLARYMVFQPPDVRQEYARLADGDASALVRQLVLQELVAAAAEQTGFQLTDDEVLEIHERYRAEMRALWAALRLDPRPAGVPAEARVAQSDGVVRRVAEYMEAVAARRIELRPVAPLLAIHLLADRHAEIVTAGVDAAVERAGRLIAAAAESQTSAATRR